MRIIKLLLQFLAATALIVALVFLVSREVFLTMGYLQIKNESDMDRAIVKDSHEYAVTCKNTFGITGETYALKGVQLRFIGDSQYQVEIVCTQHELDPIVLRSGTLPMFVTRQPGSSGLYFGVGVPVNALVNLEMWGREYQIFLRDTNAPDVAQDILYPQANCTAGYGYQCCDPLTQISDGLTVTGPVNDCKGGCFSSCKTRPTILSFRSDPAVDVETKLAPIQGESADVAFTAIIDTPLPRLKSIVLDYGDGQKETLMETEISTTHTYVCKAFPCAYTATISATDVDGLSSAQLPITTIHLKQDR